MHSIYKTSLFSGIQCKFGCKNGQNRTHPSCKVAIKSHHGKYLGAEPEYGNLRANKSEIGNWDIWTVTFVEKDKVTLKSFHQKYLRAEINGKAKANRITAGNCEKFTVKDMGDGKFAFKSYHGPYLVAELDIFGTIQVNRQIAREWETFTVVPIVPEIEDEGNLSLKYVCLLL